MTYAYIGLGSNAGSCRHNLHTAQRLLRRLPGARLTAISPLYRSAPVGCPGRQQAYHNAAAELQTTQPPQRLFRHLRRLEKRVQIKPRVRNAPRRLDADYLVHGSCRLRTAALTLPHPRLYSRAFVLRPLDDILADATTQRPINRLLVRQALQRCADQPLWRLS